MDDWILHDFIWLPLDIRGMDKCRGDLSLSFNSLILKGHFFIWGFKPHSRDAVPYNRSLKFTFIPLSPLFIQGGHSGNVMCKFIIVIFDLVQNWPFYFVGALYALG